MFPAKHAKTSPEPRLLSNYLLAPFARSAREKFLIDLARLAISLKRGISPAKHVLCPSVTLGINRVEDTPSSQTETNRHLDSLGWLRANSG